MTDSQPRAVQVAVLGKILHAWAFFVILLTMVSFLAFVVLSGFWPMNPVLVAGGLLVAVLAAVVLFWGIRLEVVLERAENELPDLNFILVHPLGRRRLCRTTSVLELRVVQDPRSALEHERGYRLDALDSRGQARTVARTNQWIFALLFRLRRREMQLIADRVNTCGSSGEIFRGSAGICRGRQPQEYATGSADGR